PHRGRVTGACRRARGGGHRRARLRRGVRGCLPVPPTATVRRPPARPGAPRSSPKCGPSSSLIGTQALELLPEHALTLCRRCVLVDPVLLEDAEDIAQILLHEVVAALDAPEQSCCHELIQRLAEGAASRQHHRDEAAALVLQSPTPTDVEVIAH